jgi:hypothetical protein
MARISTMLFVGLTLFIGACSGGGGGGGGGDSCTAPDYSCPAGQYCRLESGTCDADGAGGSCEPIPETCTQEVAPVCSCEGLSFQNPCLAEAGGHSIRVVGQECA